MQTRSLRSLHRVPKHKRNDQWNINVSHHLAPNGDDGCRMGFPTRPYELPAKDGLESPSYATLLKCNSVSTRLPFFRKSR